MVDSVQQTAQDDDSNPLDTPPRNRGDDDNLKTTDQHAIRVESSNAGPTPIETPPSKITPKTSQVIDPVTKNEAISPNSSTTTPDVSTSDAASIGEEKAAWPPAPFTPHAAPMSHLSDYPIVKLKRDRRHPYRPARQTKYLNNLMLIVGFLELTNSLDFPANVWNSTPVPTFAVGLMATGGSVSIIASFCVFRDLYLSARNFRLLREERRYLLQQMARFEEKADGKRRSMTQAYLDLNFREALWEMAERTLLDSLNGFSGILVGVGTILAIDGANPVSFEASNLLSGYVGNSFNVVYGAANTSFAIYMYLRSRTYDRAVKEKVQSPQLKKRMSRHLRTHKIYAIVNGLTAFVAAIGSMVSAKHWQGYAVLIPCVIGALFGNLFWRHVVGYDRSLCQRVPGYADVDAEQELLFAIDAAEELKQHRVGVLLEKKNGEEILHFMAENDMLEDFTARVLHDAGNATSRLVSTSDKKHIQVDYEQLLNLDEAILARSACHVLGKVGHRRFRDQERKYAELWGCQLAQQPGRRASILGPQHATREEV